LPNTEINANNKWSELISKILKADHLNISDMLERIKSSEALHEIKLDNI